MKKCLFALVACVALFSACNKEPQVVMVQSITLDKAASVVEGETTQLTATVAPDNASDKTIVWTSDNTAVATVSDNGLVTGVKEGTATITATAKDAGKVSAKCAVTVVTSKIAVESVAFEITEYIMKVGETWNENVVVITPENATDKTVTYTSSNENVATVDANGAVTAVAEGTATITVKSNDNENASATCAITVNPAPRAVVLNASYANLKVSPMSKSVTLKGYYGATLAEVTADWANREDVEGTWASSNESVVTVAGGVLTPVGPGTATVTLTDEAGNAASCEITVLADTVMPTDIYPGVMVADCTSGVNGSTSSEQVTNGPWSAKGSDLAIGDGYVNGTQCIESAEVKSYRLFNWYSSTPVDVSAVKNPALYIRLWVDDASKVNWGEGGEIELSSDGSGSYVGSEELTWTMEAVFAKQPIHNGWNNIVLPFSSANGKIGEFRPNKVNFFRIYQSTSRILQGAHLKLDQVRVIDWTEFDPCEDYQMWYDGNGVPQRQWKYFTDDKKEGEGCMGIENYLWSGADAFRLKFWKGHEFTVPFDMDENNTTFKFWLYIDKPEFLAAQQHEIELSSELSVGDAYRWAFVAGEKSYTEGWNEVSLKFSNARKEGAADIRKINWLRFILQYNGEGMQPEIVTMKIDDIKIVKE